MQRRLSNKNRKGVALMIMVCMLMFIVLPSIGLAIDGAVLYSIRAKLQSATDASCVAAARSISKGLSLEAQQGNATTVGKRFFHANMNAAWNPLVVPDPVITFPTSLTPRTIVVNVASQAGAPTYFMKIFNQGTITITAVSQTARREVKIVMVIDRSGSLANSSSCDDLREAAVSFVDTFMDGRDQIGMITYGTSYRTDFAISSSFKTVSSGQTLPQMVNNINCIGGTNSAAAYWLGYQALIATPEPGVLNVILFFTDGQPNTITMNNMELAAASTCTDRTNKTGVIAPSSNGAVVLGIYKSDPTGPPPVTSDQRVINNSSNCFYNANNSQVWRDIVALTHAGAENEVDSFGNLLTGYKTGILRDANNRIRVDDNATIVNVGINALDSAATRAREDANTRGLDVMTFAIGLSNTLGSAEDALMNRVANTPASPIFRADRPEGLYARADEADQLQAAFVQLSSEVMRFAK